MRAHSRIRTVGISVKRIPKSCLASTQACQEILTREAVARGDGGGQHARPRARRSGLRSNAFGSNGRRMPASLACRLDQLTEREKRDKERAPNDQNNTSTDHAALVHPCAFFSYRKQRRRRGCPWRQWVPVHKQWRHRECAGQEKELAPRAEKGAAQTCPRRAHPCFRLFCFLCGGGRGRGGAGGGHHAWG